MSQPEDVGPESWQESGRKQGLVTLVLVIAILGFIIIELGVAGYGKDHPGDHGITWASLSVIAFFGVFLYLWGKCGFWLPHFLLRHEGKKFQPATHTSRLESMEPVCLGWTDSTGRYFVTEAGE